MRIAKAVLIIPLVLLYCGYLYFLVRNGQGAVDYETFVDLGQRWLDGREVYVENSYYPLPTVMIFGLIAWLPSWLSIVVWHGAPVLLALWITRNPLVLGFAPLFAHFVGGQTAIFGLLGYWGYRRWQNEPVGGMWLAVTLLKPQLGIIPILWALPTWRHRKKQAMMFIRTALVIYMPSFLIDSGWLWRWLNNRRSLRPRAMAGIIPRSAIYAHHDVVLWVAVVGIGGGLLWWLWHSGRLDLDMAVAWGFVAVPLMHDYDLIQLMPMLEGKLLRVAVVLSVPLWVVIFGFYDLDVAWGVVGLIGVGVMVMKVNAPLSPPKHGGK